MSNCCAVISLGVQTWGTDLDALRRYWTAAEDLGYARVTYGDGLGDWTHDGWCMLSALAVATRRVRIGPAVTYAFDASAHHPSWLAKRAVTIDHLSGGRLDLRLGVGAEDDAAAEWWTSHGISYPSAAGRVAVLEESVHIVRALWQAADRIDYPGRFYRLHGARLHPAPVQHGGPPVWIAAMGERALAAAARHADGWEASYLSPDGFAERWTRLQSALQAVGREPAAMRRSVELDVVAAAARADVEPLVRRFCAAREIDRGHPLLETVLIGDGPALVQRIREYVRAGATDLMLGFADFPSTAMLEMFATRVLPEISR